MFPRAWMLRRVARHGHILCTGNSVAAAYTNGQPTIVAGAIWDGMPTAINEDTIRTNYQGLTGQGAACTAVRLRTPM